MTLSKTFDLTDVQGGGGGVLCGPAHEVGPPAKGRGMVGWDGHGTVRNAQSPY